MRAAPRNSGRGTRASWRSTVSNSASRNAADGELADIGGDPDRDGRRRRRRQRDAPGDEEAGDRARRRGGA